MTASAVTDAIRRQATALRVDQRLDDAVRDILHSDFFAALAPDYSLPPIDQDGWHHRYPAEPARRTLRCNDYHPTGRHRRCT